MATHSYVYIVTNKHHTVLYTGVTSDIVKRMWQHKQKLIHGFTSRYHCDKLVWYEPEDEILSAIEREKQIKAGSRKKKVMLIDRMNPQWKDLAESWY